jgi:nickel-dependent lactate racemase
MNPTAPSKHLNDGTIGDIITAELESTVAGERVLVLVPDHTRRLPLDRLIPPLAAALHRARAVEIMVAVGTHQPEPAPFLNRLAELAKPLPVPVSNHDWQNPRSLTRLGCVGADRIRALAGDSWHPSLDRDLEIRVNRGAVAADRVIIIGPTLPHEVAGFSGGTKYLFPGVSGPEMIDVMHWLSALTGVPGIIGIRDTPVRGLIDEAAALLPTPVTLLAAVTDGDEMIGLFAGPPEQAWPASVELARRLHITWLDQPVQQVVSCPLPIYPELWTAAKAVYKLAPAVTDGGELIVYAPALSELSRTHGTQIRQVGYHVMDFFLSQWDRYESVPLAVLAHSTHVKGAGSYASGRETPRITVRLATGIGFDECQQLNLGYSDPATIDLEQVAASGTLVVPDAGEQLYRVRQGPPDLKSGPHLVEAI